MRSSRETWARIVFILAVFPIIFPRQSWRRELNPHPSESPKQPLYRLSYASDLRNLKRDILVVNAQSTYDVMTISRGLWQILSIPLILPAQWPIYWPGVSETH